VLLGFRVPTVVVSPLTRNAARTPQVNRTVLDHTSVLRLIERRWGVPPLTARDASPLIGNFATALNFSAPNASVPAVPLPRPVLAAPCFENIVGLLTPYKPPAGTSPPKSRTPLGGPVDWVRNERVAQAVEVPGGAPRDAATSTRETESGLLLPEDADVNTLGDDFAVHGGQQLGA